MAEHALVCHRIVDPHHLAGDQLVAFVCIVPGRNPGEVACHRWIDIHSGIIGARIEITIDLENIRLWGGFKQIAPVVIDQKVTGTRHSGRNPSRVAGSANLLVSSGRCGPVLLNGWGIPLAVACWIPEAVEEIPVRARGQGNAGRRVSGNKSPPVVNHIELSARRVDDDLVKVRVVIDGVAVQPIP